MRNGIRQTRMAKLEELPAARRKPNHEMRISFGSASEKDIREGIKRLGAVLRKLTENARIGRVQVRLDTAKDDHLLDVQRRNKIWSELDDAKSW